MQRLAILLLFLTVLATCGRLDHLGRPPGFTPKEDGAEHAAMAYSTASDPALPLRVTDHASLWSGARGSLLGDRRAMRSGDILTVVIEIDERAEISNSTDRSRAASESLGIPEFFGYPQRHEATMTDGTSLASAVDISSTSSASGDGSVSRNEKLTLRVAATITKVLPNGVLEISGLQEVRVNFEMRELLVSGFVRPEDISRQNEITYDKIASARISYGGRGQISDMQQPRYGLQALDMILPF